MNQKPQRDREYLDRLQDYYAEHKVIPSYSVLAGLWAALVDDGAQAFIWPFVGAVIISSLLSLRLLKGALPRATSSAAAALDVGSTGRPGSGQQPTSVQR